MVGPVGASYHESSVLNPKLLVTIATKKVTINATVIFVFLCLMKNTDKAKPEVKPPIAIFAKPNIL